MPISSCHTRRGHGSPKGRACPTLAGTKNQLPQRPTGNHRSQMRHSPHPPNPSPSPKLPMGLDQPQCRHALYISHRKDDLSDTEINVPPMSLGQLQCGSAVLISKGMIYQTLVGLNVMPPPVEKSANHKKLSSEHASH